MYFNSLLGNNGQNGALGLTSPPDNSLTGLLAQQQRRQSVGGPQLPALPQRNGGGTIVPNLAPRTGALSSLPGLGTPGGLESLLQQGGRFGGGRNDGQGGLGGGQNARQGGADSSPMLFDLGNSLGLTGPNGIFGGGQGGGLGGALSSYANLSPYTWTSPTDSSYSLPADFAAWLGLR